MDPSQSAQGVLELLAEQRVCLVLAESCTGGLAAALLVGVPGASNWFCGSAVTYREATKEAWLGVSGDAVAGQTAVSEQVTREMVTGSLAKTPEAQLAAAITGHLGPAAPVELDGVVFVATLWRDSAAGESCRVLRYQLTQQRREQRQQEAAALLLARLVEVLAERGGDGP
jgi:nicotinamide-nucleotide amidase